MAGRCLTRENVRIGKGNSRTSGLARLRLTVEARLIQRHWRTFPCFLRPFRYDPRHMYPTLIKFGSFEITTFGLMMFLAFVTAGWVLTRQFRRYGLTDDLASSMVMA